MKPKTKIFKTVLKFYQIEMFIKYSTNNKKKVKW